MKTTNTAHPADWNPYLAGIALGLVLLATYVLMGFGLGSSSGVTRVAYAAAHSVAPAAVEHSTYMAPYVASNPFEDWMVFEVFGVLLGGILAAYTGKRLMKRPTLQMGPRSTVALRVTLAILGGVVMGLGARLARGCTSGQALTGGAVLSVGSWVFMLAFFAGGYLTAPFVRRMWR
ncbi:MAG: YeeE/YedE family protein [Myxococcales bacterium]|nr:YeeE/YedE family protein [Myxococcales bacterium]MCB9580453.1 YeeE/YedE family protein [Polyangiaceae bacterium]